MLLLIADDDQDAVETLAELLQILIPPPLTLVLAFDGEEALAAAIGPQRPDAVIMDIEMPRMNGVDAALRIRRVLGSEAPPVIAVTGYVGAAKLRDLSQAFDHVLPKPVNVDELLGLLSSAAPR
jgi:two-component system response regulator MprA